PPDRRPDLQHRRLPERPVRRRQRPQRVAALQRCDRLRQSLTGGRDMAMFRASLPALAIAAVLGLGAGALAVVLAGGNARQCGSGDASALAARVAEVEAELELRPAASAPPPAVPAAEGAGRAPALPAGGGPQQARPLAVAPPADVDQQLKDLLTLAWNDRRGMREKLDDFIATHPGSEGVAVASKGVFELAGN